MEGLLEDDGKSFYRQEHVVPHIGFTANPISMTQKEFKLLGNRISSPHYDYKLESNLLLRRLNITTLDPKRKAIIETLDDKLSAAILILLSHWAFFNSSYEQSAIFQAGNRLSEFEGVLISWRQELKYNLIRPTTIIQSGKYTNDYIKTYGGPFQGIQTIPLKIFKHIFVQCHIQNIHLHYMYLCLWYDHVTKYIQNEYGEPTLPIFFIFQNANKNGNLSESSIEPGGPQENVEFLWDNFKQFYDACVNRDFGVECILQHQ